MEVGLWDILYFPLLGLRGSYLRIFFKSFNPEIQDPKPEVCELFALAEACGLYPESRL